MLSSRSVLRIGDGGIRVLLRLFHRALTTAAFEALDPTHGSEATMHRQQPRASRRAAQIRVIVVVVATVVAIMLTVAVDRIAGVVVTNPSASGGLIFHPHSTATYQTPEFQFTAVTNALGFRDHEFPTGRSADCRVMAIGDSFTFGWGVSLEESWPKALETALRHDGFGVDVANLGLPGASPVDYANIADRAIPMLKPDLVVVGVLQGDDLRQMRDHRAPSGRGSWRHEVGQAVHRIEAGLYPHLTLLMGLADDAIHHRVRTLSVNATWQEQAQRSLAGLGPSELARYSELDGALRSVFEAGNLNPSLVMSALRQPDYFKATFDLAAPETQRLIEEMAGQLARIRAAAASERADVVAVSVPFGLYVSEAMFRTWRDRYGFDLDPHMLTSSAADDAILSAAARAGVSGHAFTAAFRDHDGAPFFFGLDGHLTADGHRFYAERLRPAITATLERRARCGHDRPEGGVVSAW